MKKIIRALQITSLLASTGALVLAVVPTPNGLNIAWSPLNRSGWSNLDYSVWALIPPTGTNRVFLTNTTSTSTHIPASIISQFPAETMYGVEVLGQSNGGWRTSAMG